MEYKNGYIYLEQKELDYLSFIMFNDKIDQRHEAQGFIGSLQESQALFLEERARNAAMQDRGEREAVIVDLLDSTIAACELFIEMAQSAAREAGTKIEFH